MFAAFPRRARRSHEGVKVLEKLLRTTIAGSTLAGWLIASLSILGPVQSLLAYLVGSKWLSGTTGWDFRLILATQFFTYALSVRLWLTLAQRVPGLGFSAELN